MYVVCTCTGYIQTVGCGLLDPNFFWHPVVLGWLEDNSTSNYRRPEKRVSLNPQPTVCICILKIKSLDVCLIIVSVNENQVMVDGWLDVWERCEAQLGNKVYSNLLTSKFANLLQVKTMIRNTDDTNTQSFWLTCQSSTR